MHKLLRSRTLSVLSATLLFSIASPLLAQTNNYNIGPDSMEQPGVPKGEMTHYTWTSPKVFPGTVRDYWIYVPKQYDATRPACVMVFQDGGGFQDRKGGFRVPVVFDNLIHRGEMPVTIAVMINPGVVPAPNGNALPRYNRSHEYDGVTEDYARFLIEEILPEVGKKYNLTKEATGRALSGASSGGICAFTAAWERPDVFGRVLSFIGSFTNLRGGHAYPSLIRKYEPRPIRVFLQDGSNDQDIYSGSWFIGNQDVFAALRFAGYETEFVIGDGGHDGRQGTAILPDALRWLWKGYPAPIAVPKNSRQPVMEVVIPGEEWQAVSTGAVPVSGMASDGAGNVYLASKSAGTVQKVEPSGNISPFKAGVSGIQGLAMGADGRLYATQPDRKRILAFDATGKEQTVVAGVSADLLTISAKGDVFAGSTGKGEVWQWNPNMEGKKPRKTTVPALTGFTLTPDQSLFLVNTSAGRYAYSYQLKPDATLAYPQPYFEVHIPSSAENSEAKGMTTDAQGRLYITSLAGVQICDQAGRVIGILSNPNRTATTHIAFGGPNREYLYVVAGGKVYRRKTKTKGVLSFEPPITPPGPRL